MTIWGMLIRRIALRPGHCEMKPTASRASAAHTNVRGRMYRLKSNRSLEKLAIADLAAKYPITSKRHGGSEDQHHPDEGIEQNHVILHRRVQTIGILETGNLGECGQGIAGPEERRLVKRIE